MPLTPVPPNPLNASISHRTYFYPLPSPLPPGTPIPYSINLPHTNPLGLPPKPLEPTSTLVLTSAGRWYVDVRVFRRIGREDGDGEGGEGEGMNEGGSRWRLDWAFAGTSTSTPIPDPYPHGIIPYPPQNPTTDSQPQPPPRAWPHPIQKCTWHHHLDSHHPLPTPPHLIPPDTATMYFLNACGAQAVEVATTPKFAYEEFWRDEVVRGAGEGEGEGVLRSVVLRIEDVGKGVRGVVVRVGRWCQGVVMRGAYVTVERWEFRVRSALPSGETAGAAAGDGDGDGAEDADVDADADTSGSPTKNVKPQFGSWKRILRIGDQFLPCATCWTDGVLKVGGEVRYGDYRWVVEEDVAWREGVDALDRVVQGGVEPVERKVEEWREGLVE